MTIAAPASSPSLGGLVSTGTSAVRSAERIAASTEVLPVPIPPDTSTLTGAVGAASSAATVSRAAGGRSLRGSGAGLAMAHQEVVVTGDTAEAVVVTGDNASAVVVVTGCVVVV